MQFRKFTAPDLREALAMVKRELGPDAVILSTKRVRAGLMQKPLLEVTAALDGAESSDSKKPAGHDEAIAELTNMRSRLEPEATSDDLLEALIDNQVASDIARELVSAIRDTPAQRYGGEAPNPSHERLRLRDLVASRLSSPVYLRAKGREVVALVGPTGVGKTTTIAKLAARAALLDGRKVAIISTDTYRIGADEQVRKYAELIGVPVATAKDAADIETLMRRFADVDSLFIDTAGRSPEDREAVVRLQRMTEAAHAQVHLTLAVATPPREVARLVSRFGSLRPTALCFTKLDEALSCGAVLNAKTHAALPLSYVTTGQRVPEDIAPADAQQLAHRIAFDSADEAPMRAATGTRETHAWI